MSRPIMTDEEFMQRQLDWPKWPWLPLKRLDKDGQFPECGTLWATKGPVVYKANIFGLPATVEEFLALGKIEYDSFQAILDDGWIID